MSRTKVQAVEPCYLEDPYQRAEDIKSAVRFLSTLNNVDKARIGALGVCSSGGYIPFSAQTDRRIKAVATISAADMGRLFREGLGTTLSRENLMKQLEMACEDRIKEAQGEKPHLEHIVPHTMSEIPDGTRTLYAEGTNYYRTARAQHKNSPNLYIFGSVDRLATYSSYASVDMIAPNPLLMIAVKKGDTLYFSEDTRKAAKEPKEFFVVKGKTRIDLYDLPDGVIPKLVEFMEKYLTA
jgi:fermentation-respiration switch protein FrsA (DUF1100 family)